MALKEYRPDSDPHSTKGTPPFLKEFEKDKPSRLICNKDKEAEEYVEYYYKKGEKRRRIIVKKGTTEDEDIKIKAKELGISIDVIS